MALLCSRKGCGQRFDPEKNAQDACLHHPGFPIFHDAFKGWSCCKKRTTDFSEFLSIKGCTKGYHCHEKPPELEEALAQPKLKTCTHVLAQGPKSAETLQRERPSSDEPKQLLSVKVTQALQQVLDKLDMSPATQPVPHSSPSPGGDSEGGIGMACKNAGCQAVYQGEQSEREACLSHPGVPVFHEGMKYWSCCRIKTTDFATFLEQEGCSRGKHTWLNKQEDKKLASCRQDWHQTSSQVVVTIYAKTPLPHLTSIKANRTGLDIRVAFEGGRRFQAQLDLWGVINVEKSFANLLPSKVEIALKKENPLTWAGLQYLQSQGEALQLPLPEDDKTGSPLDESDDSLSWSEEEGEDGGETK